LILIVRRNVRGDDRFYVRQGHGGYDFLSGLYENDFDSDSSVPLDAKEFQGVGGTVLVSQERIPLKG